MINWQINTFGEKKKQAILLLHGFAGDSSYWQELIPELSDNYFLIVPDMPGHGKSKIKPGTDLNFRQIATSLITAVSQDIFSRVKIIGYSMGGRLALQIKTHLPDLVENGIFISCSPGIENLEERNNRLLADKDLAEKIRSNGMDWFTKYWWNIPIFKSRGQISNERKSAILNRWRKLDSAQLALGLELLSVGRQDYLLANLKEQKNSSLYVAGELDSKYMNLLNSDFSQIENSQIRAIKNCGHDVLTEKPQELIKMIKEFLLE